MEGCYMQKVLIFVRFRKYRRKTGADERMKERISFIFDSNDTGPSPAGASSGIPPPL